MPNKRHPDRDIDDFQQALHELRGLWDASHNTLLEAPELPRSRRERLAKESCVDAFLRTAVAFEGFRSAWHITAIHRKPERFLRHLEERIRKQLRRDPSLRWVADNLGFRLPRHPDLATTTSLVDPSRRNVRLSAEGDGSWRKRADNDLEQPFRDKVAALPAGDWKVIEAIEALRDHLAHRSEFSRDRMNASLSSLPVQSLAISGTQELRADGVPRYLWAYAQGNTRPLRLEVYYDQLHDLAERLRVEAMA